MLNAEVKLIKDQKGNLRVDEMSGGPQDLILRGKSREEADTELRLRGYEPKPMMFKNGNVYSKLYSIPHNV